jgi:hypothetical protein
MHRKARNHQVSQSHLPTLTEEEEQELIQLILNNAIQFKLMKQKNCDIKLKITLKSLHLLLHWSIFEQTLTNRYTRPFILQKIGRVDRHRRRKSFINGLTRLKL